MLLIEKVEALLTSVTRKDVEHLRPAQRQRLALLLRQVADIADAPLRQEHTTPGVLYDLRRGIRAD